MSEHLLDQSYRTARSEYESRRFECAEALCNKILAIDPAHAPTLHLLALLAESAGALEDALKLVQDAIAVDPSEPTFHLTLGVILRELRREDESRKACAIAVELRPTLPEELNRRGHELQQAWRLDDAAEMFRRAVMLRPDYVEALNNLGCLLQDIGRIDEGIECLDRAIALRPEAHSLQSNRLYSLHFHPDLDPHRLADEHRRWGASYAARPAILHGNDPSPGRRLRVGYVSPDFRGHCQALFTLPTLEHHDRDRFEIFCYSAAQRTDQTTAALRAHADAWRDISALSDDDAITMIREDGIDVLVDLTLHMARNRLPIFAAKSAPVQVTWLGYPGTTGLSAIEYRLTDPHLDPPGEHDAWYVERSIRLPETFWCYAPGSEIGVGDLPAGQRGSVTFGCLNNFCKVNGPTLELWRQVLLAVPSSRFMLLAPPGRARQHVLERLGIEPQRVEFVEFQPRERYLRHYHRIDICLDTFPYNGHTTSLDALWMGVPVISLAGQHPVSRAGLSQAANLALEGFVATSRVEFVNLARDLAGDIPGLRRIRASLRSRMRASPLMDARRFVGHLESAYRKMWLDWCESRGAPR